jgi:hypothetical protein
VAEVLSFEKLLATIFIAVLFILLAVVGAVILKPNQVQAPPVQPVRVGEATFIALVNFVPVEPEVFTVEAMFIPFTVDTPDVLVAAFVIVKLKRFPVAEAAGANELPVAEKNEPVVRVLVHDVVFVPKVRLWFPAGSVIASQVEDPPPAPQAEPVPDT